MLQISQVSQDVTRGVLTDFETRICNGASAMDALKTAGPNALGKIADKLAQMAAHNLCTSALGASAGDDLLRFLGIGSRLEQRARSQSGGRFAVPRWQM
ncbi:hypothetical protein QA635_23145 [Bradyrhizobium brasilense]|uniref:hypothetical protein n=1 Tax=Bradyrhizobium brasilense TaxID=1419277 RepID=UPI0024B12F1F|nr:hypothetical protein [Bradyrhizobium australafricanum]WFU29509.1 hypothetical protein QA635_23145 [Bradyrhizobium australafricanum]